MSNIEQVRGICDEVEMTPAQCNDIIEDKLLHLLPLMKQALGTFQRVEHALANGGFSWRKAFENTKKKTSSE